MLYGGIRSTVLNFISHIFFKHEETRIRDRNFDTTRQIHQVPSKSNSSLTIMSFANQKTTNNTP